MKLRANIVQSEQRLLNLRNPRPRVIKTDNTLTTDFFDRKPRKRYSVSCFKTLSSVVTICTTRFNIQKCHVLPTQCIYVFCVDLRTNSDYFPIQHYLVGFITETECVYCAVRTGSLYIIQANFSVEMASLPVYVTLSVVL